MAENSKIEWCDDTFNPWIGCTKIGPGCDHCYAEALMQDRYHRVRWGAGAARQLTSEGNWRKPLSWNRKAGRFRLKVFCASLADVFDNEVPVEWRRALWDLIRATPNLDWLLLTKRIGNVRKMLPADWGPGYPNVWLGATVVNQAEADRDVHKLLDTPAAVRFLSCEPLLGPIDLTRLELVPDRIDQGGLAGIRLDALQGRFRESGVAFGTRVDWVIAGGESGLHARPMEPAWCLEIARACAAAGTAFFMKQGSRANWPDFKDFYRFPVELRVRQFPVLDTLPVLA